jgi:hypothetical protein
MMSLRPIGLIKAVLLTLRISINQPASRAVIGPCLSDDRRILDATLGMIGRARALVMVSQRPESLSMFAQLMQLALVRI